MSEPLSIHVSGLRVPGTIPPNPADWDKLDVLLEDLPPGMPLLPPEDAGNFEKYTHSPGSSYAPGGGWKNCARALEQYDADLCKGYREEIDTLLVFAGLFSAVVTAFTIESYQWLQADPNDAIVVLLSQIAQSVSRTDPAVTPVPATAGLPDSASVRINIYWFLALALSLSAALVAILCKQWVREFERNPRLTSKNFVGIHQTKLKGFEQWRVGGIISLLPLLLQLALAIFALGILELLWQLHSVVAAVVCVPTVAAFIFYTATTIIPALQYPYHSYSFSPSSFWATTSECPYKSPQALLVFPVYGVYLWLKTTVAAGALYLAYCLSLAHYHLIIGTHPRNDMSRPFFSGEFSRLHLYVPEWRMVSWYMNLLQPLSIYRGLSWMRLNIDDGDLQEWIWHCLWEQATEPEFDPDSYNTKEQGFLHVTPGTPGRTRRGLRALALSYLLETCPPSSFAMEAYVQNLNAMNPESATYLADQLRAGLFQYYIDAEKTATILRAVAAYGRVHIQEPIGDFLVSVAGFAFHISDPALRTILLRHSLLLYHIWIGTQPVPQQPATVETTAEMVRVQTYWLQGELETHHEHVEHLHRRPGIHELAGLVTLYAESHEDPVAALAAKLGRTEDAIGPVFRALLDMARHGVRQDDAEIQAAEANDSALALPASGSSSGTAVRPHAFSAVDELQSRTERNSGRGAMSHARDLGQLSSDRPTVEGSGGHDAVPPDSPTLRAVVIHSSAGKKSAQTPSEDESHAQTRGDGGKTSAAEGAPFQGGSAALRAPAPSGEQHARRSSGYYEARSQTDGETGGDTSGDAYDGGTHESPALPSRSALVHAPSSAVAQPLPQHERAALPDNERSTEATGDGGEQETSGSGTDGRSEGHGSQNHILHAVVIHAPSSADAQMIPEHDRAVAVRALDAEAIRTEWERADDAEGACGGQFGLDDSATRAIHTLSRAPLAHDGSDAGDSMDGETCGDSDGMETPALGVMGNI